MAADQSQGAQVEASRGSRPVSGFHLPDSVHRLLGSLRSQIRRRVVLDGLLVAALCVLLVFWFGALIDYVPVTVGSNETPRWLRAALLVVMGLGVGWAILWRLGRRVIARLSNRSLAVLIERHFPQLNYELVTVVELTDKPSEDVSNPTAYRAMLRRVHDSVAQHVAGLDLGGLLNWKPVWLQATAVAALLLLTAGVAIAKPEWMGLWSSRLFSLSDERWPRLARLQADGVQLQLPTFTGQLAADRLTIPFETNTVRVPRGSSVVLQVLADTTARQVPELCTLFYQLADGARGRANMRRLGGNRGDWQTFMLDGPPLVDLSGDVMFDVVGGDARLDDFRLQVVDPAVVTSMELDLTYPPYLLSSHSGLPPQELLPFRSGQRIAEGTQVVLKGAASGPLREVQYVVRTLQTKNAQFNRAGLKNAKETLTSSATVVAGATTNGGDHDQQGAVDDAIEIKTVRPDGQHFEIPLGILRDTTVVEIRLLDEFGLASDQIPRYTVTVLEDMQPEVETRLVGIGSAVTPKAVMPIAGTARDDHALARVWTTVVLNEEPPLELETPVKEDGQLESRVDLLELAEKHGFNAAPDSTLGLVVSAADRFDLDGIKHIGSGQPFQVAVLTEDKVLVLLDRQELELRQRLELIISELTQLRDVLREMSRTDNSTNTNPTSAGRRRESHRSFTGLAGLRAAAPIPAAPSQAAPSQAAPSQAAPSQAALTRAALTPATLAAAVFNEARDQAGEGGGGEADAQQQDAEQLRRLLLLRAQQSVLQADKSQQELLGVATRVEDIRLQLINNRIDNIDRQTRLHERVYLPLESVLQREMEEFRGRLAQLQTASMSPQGSAVQAAAAADANDRVLVALDVIVANLLDLASYNEIIDLVRDILDEEERLLEETQKKQKQNIFDILK